MYHHFTINVHESDGPRILQQHEGQLQQQCKPFIHDNGRLLPNLMAWGDWLTPVRHVSTIESPGHNIKIPCTMLNMVL